MQSIAVKQFLAVVPLNIQIQSLEAYHTCKIFNNFVFYLQEAFINTCVAVEVGCWFFIGECIGKGGLIGYDV